MRTVVIERWVSSLADSRTCARCAALHGQTFPRGDGPQPPLHWHCRCARVVDHIEHQHDETDLIRIGLEQRRSN